MTQAALDTRVRREYSIKVYFSAIADVRIMATDPIEAEGCLEMLLFETEIGHCDTTEVPPALQRAITRRECNASWEDPVEV